MARTRQALLPPSARSRAAQGLTWAAAEGDLPCSAARNAIATLSLAGRVPELPVQQACLRGCPLGAKLVSATTIRMTGDAYFREHMPWRQGIVTSDCGPQIIANCMAAAWKVKGFG